MGWKQGGLRERSAHLALGAVTHTGSVSIACYDIKMAGLYNCKDKLFDKRQIYKNGLWFFILGKQTGDWLTDMS